MATGRSGAGRSGGGKGGGGTGYNSPLYQPTQTLAGKQLGNAAQQLANVQTIGPLHQLAQQIVRNNRQGAATQKLTSGYFNQLGQQAKQGVAQEGQIGANLNSTLSGIANETQGTLRGIGSNASSSLAQYAPQGEGAGLSNAGFQGLTAEMARQQGLAAQDAGAYRAFGANQGANYQGLAASNRGVFALRGQERLADIARATRLENVPLTSKQAELIAKKGALYATALGSLRQSERNYQVAQQGIGLKQSAINASLANTAARNATATSIANANRSAANNRHAHPVFNPNTGTGSGGSTKNPYTTGANRTGQAQLSQAVGLITALRAKGLSNAAIHAELAGKYKLPDYIIQGGFDLYTYHYLNPKTASALHQAGLKGGTFQGSPIPIGSTGGSGGYLARDYG